MLGDLLQGGLYGAGDVEPGALRRGARSTVAAAQSDGAADLAHDEVDFGFDLLGAFGIAARTMLFEFFPEFPQTPPVLFLRLRIEHLARVAQAADADGRVREQCGRVGSGFRGGRLSQNVEGVKFLARVL
ncbi:MAG: hypothetical protein ACLQAT_31290 [Candidatus Binataceae bacterium]